MKNYPQEVERVALRVAELSKQIDDYRTLQGGIEHAAWASVLAATDERGRAAYTNDRARETAVDGWLNKDPEYLDLTGKLSKAEYDRDVYRARLERLRSEFKLHLLDREEQIAERRQAAA